MSFIKSNYGLKRDSSKTENKTDVKDLEAEMLKHVGGSFVYVKTDKFIIQE